jgi:hypothetical protein
MAFTNLKKTDMALHSHNVEFYNIKYNSFKISLINAV